MKKEWKKPQLVVMTRSKPEESVLTTCKYTCKPGPYENDCYVGWYGTEGGNCHSCNVRLPS